MAPMSAAQPPAPDSFADAVRSEPAAAGLPVLPPDPYVNTTGGGVSVHGDDPDQGVWVGWNVDDSLRDASINAFSAGAYRRDGSEVHPAIRHSGAVEFAIADAIQAILESAGFQVDKDVDDMQPGTLLVRAQRPGPTWRDPVTPPLAGAGGYLSGTRVRLVEGEHAGLLPGVLLGHLSSISWDGNESGDPS